MAGPHRLAHKVRVLDMKACDTGIFMCPTTGRLPLGVLISAYSTDDGIFGRLLSEANDVGASVKRWNPDVPTALITHRPALTSNESFDLAVPVRDDLLMKGAPRGNGGYTPQWFTRLYYYASSPFDITIALDSNAGVCGSVMPLFEATRAVDFAVPTQLRDWTTACGLSAMRSFWPHNFMMTYVITSKATQALFQNWVMQQLQKGVPVDDQHTLFAAIHHTISTAGLRPGLISSAGGGQPCHPRHGILQGLASGGHTHNQWECHDRAPSPNVRVRCVVRCEPPKQRPQAQRRWR